MTPEAQQLALRPRVSLARSRTVPRSATIACAGVLLGIPLLPMPLVVTVAAIMIFGGVVAHQLAGAGAGDRVAAFRAWRERSLRREVRMDALVSAGCALEPLRELDGLVTRVEHDDPAVAQHLDLEALLDRHVVLAIAHQRALRALVMSDRPQLVHIRDAQRADPDHDPRRLELCERRLRCHDDCAARAQALADELAIVADLIRLVAQRSACPGELASDDTIEHCLAELDGRDAAQRQLAAELWIDQSEPLAARS